MDYRRARELLNDGVAPLDPAAVRRLQLLRVARSEPAALDLLRLMAFLASDPLPLDLLLSARPHQLGPRLQAVVGNAEALANLIGALRGYSLASSDEDGLQVQPDLQVHIRQNLNRQEAALWAERAARLVLDAFPVAPDDSRQWEWISRLKPHALEAAHHTEQADSDYAWRLLTAVGIYLGSRGCSREQLREASRCLYQAYELAEGRHGPDDHRVALILEALGPVSCQLGDIPSARYTLERALRIDHARAHLRSPDYFRTSATLNNLSLVLLRQGDAQSALKTIKDALTLCEAVYGPGDRESAWPLASLGIVLRELHDLPAARDALDRALRIEQAVYGPGHIEVAHTLYALAGVLYDQGDLQGASEALEDALHIFETAYGYPQHPLVMATLLFLAIVNLRLRRLRAAWHNVRRIRLLEGARRAA